MVYSNTANYGKNKYAMHGNSVPLYNYVHFFETLSGLDLYTIQCVPYIQETRLSQWDMFNLNSCMSQSICAE